jgi:hypothetical protein
MSPISIFSKIVKKQVNWLDKMARKTYIERLKLVNYSDYSYTMEYVLPGVYFYKFLSKRTKNSLNNKHDQL